MNKPDLKQCILTLSGMGVFIILSQCVTPYDPELTLDYPKLTVDGLVTDQPGPYSIKLTYSTSYTAGSEKSEVTVDDALVYIIDDAGNEEILAYTRGGTYATSPSGLKGEVGRQYSLRVELANGKVYESAPERLNAVSKIDTIYSEYRRLETRFLRGQFDVFLETSDPGLEKNYYMWKWTHHARLDYCNTYAVTIFRNTYWYASYCCQECYLVEKCNGCVNIGTDELTDGRRITRVPLLTFPYDTRLPYFVIAEQYSLTEAAFEFWKSVRQLNSNSGGVFDKPPLTVKGNIYNVEDAEEQVLGFFGASAVQTKSVYFRRNSVADHPFPGPIQDYIIDTFYGCFRCDEIPNFRTFVKPQGWDDAPTY